MGSENSKSKTLKEREYTDKAIAEALERQRRLYEAKCEEIRKAQIQAKGVKENNDLQNTSPSVKLDYPKVLLYPDLVNIDNNNIQLPADYFQINCPSTSRTVFPPTAPVPSAPAATTTSGRVQIKFNKSSSLSRPRPRLSKKSKNAVKLVQCVTCQNQLGSTIYNCPNGHSSCLECKLRDSRCGLCSQSITNMRNKTLEETLSKLKLDPISDTRAPCPNANDGCSLHFKKTELNEHLKECLYNDLLCPTNVIIGRCTWKGKINHIESHFNDMHPELYIAHVGKEMWLSDTNSNRRILHFINFNSNNFLVHIKININQNVIYVAVQLFSSKFSAAKWTYELHVYNKKEPQRKYQYIDVCHSNITPIHNIFNENKCAVLSLAYAKTFLDNTKIFYKIYLKNNNEIHSGE